MVLTWIGYRRRKKTGCALEPDRHDAYTLTMNCQPEAIKIQFMQLVSLDKTMSIRLWRCRCGGKDSCVKPQPPIGWELCYFLWKARSTVSLRTNCRQLSLYIIWICRRENYQSRVVLKWRNKMISWRGYRLLHKWRSLVGWEVMHEIIVDRVDQFLQVDGFISPFVVWYSLDPVTKKM